MPTAQAESPRESVLDALAALMCLARCDIRGADLMVATYASEPQTFMSALAAVALCAVRYAAMAAGQTPENLLAGVAMEIRSQA
jgi:hypothetical protein